MNNWKKLCEEVNYLNEIRVKSEDSFHRAIEKQLKTTFGWPSDYVKREQGVKTGSESRRIDTVLEGDGFGIIIEMKTLDNPLEGDEDGQLISYMSNYYTARDGVRCKYGILIGKVIMVYFQPEPAKKPERVAAFGFDKDSKDGNALFEILSYGNCSDEKLRAYMAEPRETEKPPISNDDKEKEMKGREKLGKNFDEEFRKIKKAFEDEGFSMLKPNGEDFLMSEGKNGVHFGPHFRKDELLPDTKENIEDRIWQIVWAGIDKKKRDGAWFNEQVARIKKKYNDSCYPSRKRDDKLWIKTDHRHLDEDVIEELIQIVNDTKGIMEYETGEPAAKPALTRANQPR